MLRASETAGPGGWNHITSRWLFHALPHQIQYDVVQSPVHPFQIKASVAPPSGFNAAIVGSTHVAGVTVA